MNMLRLLLWFAVLVLLLLRPRPMLLSFMEVMDTELVWDMLVLAMVLDLAMLVLAMDMDLLPQLLPDTESPMLPTLYELLELLLLLSPPLLEDMLELAGMLPTLPVLSMLPSVRLRLSQRLKLMLVFCMEPMDMVPVLDMLDSDTDILVLDMLDMVVMDLDMAVLATMARGLLMLSPRLMLVLATMARGLLMLSPRLMLVCTMEDMDMALVWDMLDLDMDILDLDMLDMVVMDSDMEDTDLVMDVPSMVKHLSN